MKPLKIGLLALVVCLELGGTVAKATGAGGGASRVTGRGAAMTGLVGGVLFGFLGLVGLVVAFRCVIVWWKVLCTHPGKEKIDKRLEKSWRDLCAWTPTYPGADRLPPSGVWTGTCREGRSTYPVTCQLEFNLDGSFRGEGDDKDGRHVMMGKFELASGSIRWLKSEASGLRCPHGVPLLGWFKGVDGIILSKRQHQHNIVSAQLDPTVDNRIFGGYRSNQGKSGTLSLKFDPVAAPLPSQLEQRDRETEVDSIADESVWVPQPEGVEAVTGILTSNPPRSRPRTPRLEENLTLQLPGMASAPPPPPDA